MSPVVRVLAGNDPDALTDGVLQEYARALQEGRGRQLTEIGLWLTPTARTKPGLTRRLLKEVGGGCWTPNFHTFDSFAEWLLRRAGRPATPISSTVQRLLIRRITQELAARQALSHFSPVVQTAGFLDVVEAFIAELKRDEIWPEDFLEACGPTEATPRDRELGAIYQRYQEVLREHQWYDREGRFWHAKHALADGRCGTLPEWSFIAVVGFGDFTRTQHKILELLARHTSQLVISLPVDPARPEVFAKPELTWERLQQSFPRIVREPLRTLVHSDSTRGAQPTLFDAGTTASPKSRKRRTRSDNLESPLPTGGPKPWPRFRSVVQHGMFLNPRNWTPSTDAGGLEIVATTGPNSERAAVARRIKSLLAEGVSAGEIVVGLRSLTTDGVAWTQALKETGLPAWCELGPPVKEQGLVKFLFAVLQAEIEDWPFARLQTVLDSSFFRADVPGVNRVSAVRLACAALRRLQLPQQRTAILETLERVADQGANRESASAFLSDISLDVLARRALSLLHWYSEQTASLRRSHTLADWIHVLAELVERLGVIVPAAAATESELADRKLWDRLQRSLRDATETADRAYQPPPRWNVAEFLTELRDLIAEERLDPPAEPAGCVRVLSFDQIRHLTCPYLFLAGLTEDSFPRRRNDDCLFTDIERERLVQRGLSLLIHARHQQEEMFFFQTLLLQASHGLTISYPEIDLKGQPVFPSPYLASLRGLFTPETVPLQREGQLDPVPPIDVTLSSSDVRLVAMEAALAGEPGWLRTLGETATTQPMVANLMAAVEMNTARFHTRDFSPYEGRLERPPHLAALAERFGPQHQFSATELETYAGCPFFYWLKTVLRLKPLADPTEGTDPQERGIIVHGVLAQLLEPMIAGEPPATLAEKFRNAVAEKLNRQPGSTELQRALTRIERELLDDWANAYSDQVARYADLLASSWGADRAAAPPEVPFGDMPGDAPDPTLPVYPPLELGADQHRVLVRGRIDRVDFGTTASGPVYTVIDYKTGRRPRFTLEHAQSGKALQLALYTLAVQRLGIAPADATPFQLGYWCLRETGFRGGLTKPSETTYTPVEAAVWQALIDALEDIVPRLARGIRSGEFVVENADLKCTGQCEFHTVCRVNQVRPVADSLEKRRRLNWPEEDVPS